MSDFYNDLITGLNEAIAIERGEIDGRITVSDRVNEYELPDWFCGRQTIDLSKVSKIADKFGESVQYFLTGSHISKSEYTKNILELTIAKMLILRKMLHH